MKIVNVIWYLHWSKNIVKCYNLPVNQMTSQGMHDNDPFASKSSNGFIWSPKVLHLLHYLAVDLPNIPTSTFSSHPSIAPPLTIPHLSAPPLLPTHSSAPSAPFHEHNHPFMSPSHTTTRHPFISLNPSHSSPINPTPFYHSAISPTPAPTPHPEPLPHPFPPSINSNPSHSSPINPTPLYHSSISPTPAPTPHPWAPAPPFPSIHQPQPFPQLTHKPYSILPLIHQPHPRFKLLTHEPLPHPFHPSTHQPHHSYTNISFKFL